MKGLAGVVCALSLGSLAQAQTPTFTAANCNSYNPRGINWAGVRTDVLAYLNRANCNLLPELLPCKRMAAVFIRVAAHDALTNPGADGSIILAPAEQSYSHNQKPFPFVRHARTALQALVTKYRMTWSDAIAVAGAVATEWATIQNGNPHVVVRSLRVGRCDSTAANPDTLPNADLNFAQYVAFWQAKGFTMLEADALMGVHTMMEDGTGPGANGVTQYRWNVRYYRDLRVGQIAVNAAGTGVTWTIAPNVTRRWIYSINDARLTDAAVDATCQAVISTCPFAAQHKANYLLYANNPGRWDGDYNLAYNKMMNRGARFSTQQTIINLGGVLPRAS